MVLPKSGWSCGVTGRVDVIQSLFFPGIQNKTTHSGFPKTFNVGYLFVFVEYLCNRSPKTRTKRLQKLHFDFNYCNKLLELARCFNPLRFESEVVTDPNRTRILLIFLGSGSSFIKRCGSGLHPDLILMITYKLIVDVCQTIRKMCKV